MQIQAHKIELTKLAKEYSEKAGFSLNKGNLNEELHESYTKETGKGREMTQEFIKWAIEHLKNKIKDLHKKK